MSTREASFFVTGMLMGVVIGATVALFIALAPQVVPPTPTPISIPHCTIDEVSYNPPIDELGGQRQVYIVASGDCPGGNPRAIRIMRTVNNGGPENQGEDPQTTEIGRVIELLPGANIICIEVAPVGDTDWSHPAVARDCTSITIPE